MDGCGRASYLCKYLQSSERIYQHCFKGAFCRYCTLVFPFKEGLSYWIYLEFAGDKSVCTSTCLRNNSSSRLDLSLKECLMCVFTWQIAMINSLSYTHDLMLFSAGNRMHDSTQFQQVSCLQGKNQQGAFLRDYLGNFRSFLQNKQSMFKPKSILRKHSHRGQRSASSKIDYGFKGKIPWTKQNICTKFTLKRSFWINWFEFSLARI